MPMDTGSVMSMGDYLAELGKDGGVAASAARRLTLRFALGGHGTEVAVECHPTQAARFRTWLERCSQRYGWNGQIAEEDVYRVEGRDA